MTTCANCGATQGPFVRDADLPRHPVCGKGKDRERIIRDCLARRDARYRT